MNEERERGSKSSLISAAGMEVPDRREEGVLPDIWKTGCERGRGRGGIALAFFPLRSQIRDSERVREIVFVARSSQGLEYGSRLPAL